MSKAPNEIKKRQIVLNDGRYMIFYTVASADVPDPEPAAVLSPEAAQDRAEEDN